MVSLTSSAAADFDAIRRNPSLSDQTARGFLLMKSDGGFETHGRLPSRFCSSSRLLVPARGSYAIGTCLLRGRLPAARIARNLELVRRRRGAFLLRLHRVRRECCCYDQTGCGEHASRGKSPASCHRCVGRRGMFRLIVRKEKHPVTWNRRARGEELSP